MYSDIDPIRICVNNDTTKWFNTPTKINVERSRNDLLITAKKDSLQRLIQVNSKLSTAFWLGNLFSGAGIIGYAIDFTNSKRFTYPRYISINFNNSTARPIKNYRVLLAPEKNIIHSQQQNVLIKLCPVALIDEVSFPTIQAGIEFKISKKLSWYNEFGIKYRKSYYEKSDTNFVTSNGFKAKTEIRYYLKNNNETNLEGKYFAVNAFLTKDTHNTEIGYFYNGNTSLLKTDAFGVKKTVFGLNFIYGYQELLTKKISVDIYTGLGIRFRNINTVNKEFNQNRDSFDGPIDINIGAIRQEIDANAGFNVRPNFTFGFRVCYKLK